MNLSRSLLCFLLPALLLVTLFPSCKSKNTTRPPSVCDTVACINGGKCEAGGCNCPTGYSGVHCEVSGADRFTGYWRVSEKGSMTTHADYFISLEGTSKDSLRIQNFNNYFLKMVKAWVIGDSIVIPTQGLEGKIVRGSGYIYSSVDYGQYGIMRIRYQVTDSATLVTNDYGYDGTSGADPSRWTK